MGSTVYSYVSQLVIGKIEEFGHFDFHVLKETKNSKGAHDA